MKPIDMEKVKADAKRLFRAAERLNEVSDEFNKAITSIEQALTACNLGVEAEFSVNPRLILGYGKVDNHWGIYIKDSSAKWRINSAPRTLRIACIDSLPELLEELIKVTNSLSQDMMLKVSVAKDMVRGLPNAKQ